jgi:hypothetical protein
MGPRKMKCNRSSGRYCRVECREAFDNGVEPYAAKTTARSLRRLALIAHQPARSSIGRRETPDQRVSTLPSLIAFKREARPINNTQRLP